ncbi:Os06g0606599 [Oryza sativa Japonica Group]|uniref:Os06g0606599 protein n=1 Tax=Oryza sativa subsp. japonica TaxID=39947 RepID=A0A0P0WYQ1_ORYSJ|nr:Os06g0606599 [Oryza sativa Japonica Group]
MDADEATDSARGRALTAAIRSPSDVARHSGGPRCLAAAGDTGTTTTTAPTCSAADAQAAWPSSGDDALRSSIAFAPISRLLSSWLSLPRERNIASECE